MSDKALFEVTLKDGQKLHALFPTGWMSSSSEKYLYCDVFGQRVAIAMEDVASVSYAGGIDYSRERRMFTTDEDGQRHYEYTQYSEKPVSRFPFKSVPQKNDFIRYSPSISRYDYAFIGNVQFRKVEWDYYEYFDTGNADNGTDQIQHLYYTYMTAADYRRLMAQWAKELADREIEYAES